MSLTRRTFVAAAGAIGIAGSAAKTLAAPFLEGIQADARQKTLSFTRPITRGEFKRALRTLEVPHRWVLADSAELREWRVTTPQLARGFGWSTLDSDGIPSESWAELAVDSFDNDREFDVTVGEERLSTDHGSLHFRCERFPNVQIHDLTGRVGRRDHLQLLAKSGTPARAHRLVAVA